jgi:hypothetical protein
LVLCYLFAIISLKEVVALYAMLMEEYLNVGIGVFARLGS